MSFAVRAVSFRAENHVRMRPRPARDISLRPGDVRVVDSTPVDYDRSRDRAPLGPGRWAQYGHGATCDLVMPLRIRQRMLSLDIMQELGGNDDGHSYP
jgi:hypothetical protein